MSDDTPSRGRRLWLLVNEVVSSPLFVFVVGGSFVALLPRIEEWRLSPTEREARQVEQQSRADAALIAPFLANLNASEPGRYRASAAALLALEDASRRAHGGDAGPLFEGVNSAIASVAQQLWPQPAVTAETTHAEVKVQPLPPPASGAAAGASPDVGSLANAIVYIQVDRADATAQGQASQLRTALGQKSVLVPAVQRMPSLAIPKKTQVRYFNEADQSAAQSLAAFVSLNLGTPVYTARPPLPAKPGTLEIWFGHE